MFSRHIEIIHRPRDIEIGVGVEPVDEGTALMPQIGFHFEVGVETVGHRLALLQPPPEFPMQRRFRQIGDVRFHSRHRQPPAGPFSLRQVIALAPVGIRHDGLPADFMKRDILR